MKILLPMLLALSVTSCVTDEPAKNGASADVSTEGTEDGPDDQPTSPGADTTGDENRSGKIDVAPDTQSVPPSAGSSIGPRNNRCC
jgi:hypothetical protein